jgi:murein DD-endopeptidase MepM/ murein hydrolase activator NlpD
MTVSYSQSIEIRTLPEATLFTYEASGAQNLKNIVIHNISLINNFDRPIEIQSVKLESLIEETCVQTKIINSDELNGIAQYLFGAQKQGVIDALNFVFRPDLLLGPTKTLSSSPTLEPGQALFLPNNPVLIPANCDTIRIRANATHNGQPIEKIIELSVSEYKQKNDYRFPLEGTCYVSSGADLYSEHRWVNLQEFGIDIVRLSGDGGMYFGSGLQVEDYYGYGSEVMASASGVVLKAVDGVSNSVDRLPREGESIEEYFRRLLRTSSEMLIGDPYRGMGNYVLIKHSGCEFSVYGHLKPGSVCVKEGDHVVQGDLIGHLGHSGNSPFPHLHFQVSDGRDIMYARSLPVQFSNISILARPCLTGYVRTGDIVKTNE